MDNNNVKIVKLSYTDTTIVVNDTYVMPFTEELLQQIINAYAPVRSTTIKELL